MAQVGVSITKSNTFRGVAQEFGNTYHYFTANPLGTAVASALIDEVANLEKPMFSNSVNFIRGRCWSSGGTKQENQMLADKPLTGIGGFGAGNPNLDRERAFLVRFRAGVDTRGNPVYLRKWWHLDINALASQTISDGQKQNTAQLSASQQLQLETWGNLFKNLTVVGVQFELVAESGRQITGNTNAHPYLEHRQLGDQWRG